MSDALTSQVNAAAVPKRLFDVIPERFFSVLSSPLRDLYADALFVLHELYEDQPLGVARESLVQGLTELVEDWSAATGRSLSEEDPELSEVDLSSPRARASAIVLRLERAGWISVDRRPDYTFFVMLHDYASTILESLVRVVKGRETEYQSYVFGTYTQLNTKEEGRNVWQAIEVARELTESLLRELWRLRDNIGRYIDRVVRHTRPQDLLAAHFLDYRQDVLDRSYHRLKTSDNVSKYRPRILARVNRWLEDPRWLMSISRELVANGRFESTERAREQVIRNLQYIRSAYEGIDDLIEEIDRRNERYVRASVERVKYFLSSSQDTEGKLREALAFMASQLATGAWQPDQEIPVALRPRIDLCSLALFQPGSLFTPRSARREHSPTPMVDDLDTGDRDQGLLRVRRRVAEQITVRRINQYLAEKMGNRKEIRAQDLGIETTRDFIHLICIGAFAPHRRVDYTIDYTGDMVTSAGGKFRFKNVLIKRK